MDPVHIEYAFLRLSHIYDQRSRWILRRTPDVFRQLWHRGGEALPSTSIMFGSIHTLIVLPNINIEITAIVVHIATRLTYSALTFYHLRSLCPTFLSMYNLLCIYIRRSTIACRITTLEIVIGSILEEVSSLRSRSTSV